ncbi:MAG: HDIG domain-containing metalloprotein [Planctomycetota bacterium]|jgi:putative nucleotidyltransferase with HDIG domain
MNREQAWQILNEYTANPALVRHGQCVEAAMVHYARLSGEDEALWGLAGLLHDFDYERWPEPPEHTRKGAEILRQANCDGEVIGAICSHVPWNIDEYPRDRPIRKTLFAVDELCGFVYAAALVRPERMAGMKPKSIVKKLKQRSFAAAVSREDIHEGAELLGIDLSEHIGHCIKAIDGIADQVGLVPEDQ